MAQLSVLNQMCCKAIKGSLCVSFVSTTRFTVKENYQNVLKFGGIRVLILKINVARFARKVTIIRLFERFAHTV